MCCLSSGHRRMGRRSDPLPLRYQGSAVSGSETAILDCEILAVSRAAGGTESRTTVSGRHDRDRPAVVDRLLEFLGDSAAAGDLDLAAAGNRRREEILAVGLDLDGLAGVAVQRDDNVSAGHVGRNRLAPQSATRPP